LIGNKFWRVSVRLLDLQGSGLSMRRLAALCLSFGVVAFCLVMMAPPARADDDEPPRPTPRTAITIGGASVVLVAPMDKPVTSKDKLMAAMGLPPPTGKLYVFVDRLDNNAPVADAKIEIDTADGDTIPMQRAPMTLNKATDGLFVGPLNRAGRQQDAFMVTLESSVGSGQQEAEITYTDVIPPPGMAMMNQRRDMAIAAVSASLGIITTVVFMLWLRASNRKRATAARSGTVQAA
jgi:hypothetical protein